MANAFGGLADLKPRKLFEQTQNEHTNSPDGFISNHDIFPLIRLDQLGVGFCLTEHLSNHPLVTITQF